MFRQGLILSSYRDYAQAMRLGLLAVGNAQTRIDVELDALRAMQLVPQQYELILLDRMLDAMDGLQLLLLLKQQAPATKFIIVSDTPDEISRAQAYQNGADFFLERPRTTEGMRTAQEAIKGLLKRHQDSKPLRNDDDTALSGLADIVQTHCLSGDSVLLHVRGNHQSGDIFIFRGEIYHAQYPGKSGDRAFHDMMQWDGGQVRTKAHKLSHVPPRTIETPYQELLDAAKEFGALDPDMRPPSGELLSFSAALSSEETQPSVVEEAPPLEDTGPVPAIDLDEESEIGGFGETTLPAVNSHWKVNLMGELVEGSQMAEPDRCAFITYFIYRKMADIAVTLEVDYFNKLTLMGPHLQQVLVADNLGVRHAVFDTAWTSEEKREQYVKWACEQSF